MGRLPKFQTSTVHTACLYYLPYLIHFSCSIGLENVARYTRESPLRPLDVRISPPQICSFVIKLHTLNALKQVQALLILTYPANASINAQEMPESSADQTHNTLSEADFVTLTVRSLIFN